MKQFAKIGILIEVEYGPCSVPNQCWNLLREFMSGFVSFSVEPHPLLTTKMNDLVSPMDTTQQYNDQFNQLRKATATQASGLSMNTATTSSSALLATNNAPNSSATSTAASAAASPSLSSTGQSPMPNIQKTTA